MEEDGRITVAVFPNGGKVEKYSIGEYNDADKSDLENIAFIKASKEGSIVQILPKIDADNPLYKNVFPDLEGTIYERKCPDLRVITIREGRRYIEYESHHAIICQKADMEESSRFRFQKNDCKSLDI